ncbi:MAG: class I SAM-dependent methyltransferase [Candidatus Aminicenantes bacterium]|nr:class I SAM-dependent methyltransferase [Candidatus Aminicenantes bacterium]
MNEKDFYRLAVLDEKMWYFKSIHLRMAYWIEQMMPHKALKLLECGCGTGGLIKFILKKKPDLMIVGLDISFLACKLSQQKIKASFTAGSIESLPFIENCFDAIIISDTICQVDNPTLVFQNLARTVKPGGYIFINEPAFKWLWSYHDEAYQTKRRFSGQELILLAKKNGFIPIFITYVNFFIFPIFLLRRKLFPPKEAKSDVRIYPEPFETIMMAISRLELLMHKIRCPYPVGSSVFLVAKKAKNILV